MLLPPRRWPSSRNTESIKEFDPDRGPALNLTESVGLLTPLVARVARDVGARVLFIKGPILTAQGLREGHASVDVDVLVEPDRLPVLLAGLELLGWGVPHEPTSALVLPLHSTTLRHSRWGCELDVHNRFPGFLADPSDVFEALWERRTTIRIAHQDIPCPDPSSHAVIAALHWLRDGRSPSIDAKLDYLVSALDARLDESGRAELVEFVRSTGAVETVRPLLDGLALHPAPTDHDTTLWRIRTASTGVKSIGWLVELRTTPLRRLPARLWHAVVLTEAEIRNEQPNAAPGPWGLFRARLRRLRYGLRDLPRAARIIRRARQGR